MAGLGLPRHGIRRQGQAALLHARRATRSTGRASSGTACDLALRSSLERWGLVEAGARFGRVKTIPRAGLDLPESDDRSGRSCSAASWSTPSTTWPGRSAGAGWQSRRLEPRRAWARIRSTGGRGLEARLGRAASAAARRRSSTASSASRASDLPVYDWYRIGGVELLPGYRHEELKGAQALAAALSLRLRLAGQLRLLVRAGAGDVFARTSEISLDSLRWGLAVGAYHPSPIGPVSLELAVRDGGRTLTTLTLGWN